MCTNSPEGGAKELKGLEFIHPPVSTKSPFVFLNATLSTLLKKQALVSDRLRALRQSFLTPSVLVIINISDVVVFRSFLAAFAPSHSSDSRSNRRFFDLQRIGFWAYGRAGVPTPVIFGGTRAFRVGRASPSYTG